MTACISGIVVSAAFEGKPEGPPAPGGLCHPRQADGQRDPPSSSTLRPPSGKNSRRNSGCCPAAHGQTVDRRRRPPVGRDRHSGAKTPPCPSCGAALLTRTGHPSPTCRASTTSAPAARCSNRWASRSPAMADDGDLDASGVDNPVAPTRWSRPCAPPSSCSARWWRASARPGESCPAAARSARVRWISTSRACRPWAPRWSSTATMRYDRAAPEGRPPVHRHGDRHRHRNLMMAAAWPTARPSSRTPRARPKSSTSPTAWWRWARRSPAPAAT